MIPENADANFDSEMATLAGDEASVIVLLSDGFDPAVVRSIFVQVLCWFVCIYVLLLRFVSL